MRSNRPAAERRPDVEPASAIIKAQREDGLAGGMSRALGHMNLHEASRRHADTVWSHSLLGSRVEDMYTAGL